MLEHNTHIITESALAINFVLSLFSICNSQKINAFSLHSLFGFDLFHRFQSVTEIVLDTHFIMVLCSKVPHILLCYYAA